MIATEKLQGYLLINQDKDVTYSIVKYESPFLFKVNNTDDKSFSVDVNIRNNYNF